MIKRFNKTLAAAQSFSLFNNEIGRTTTGDSRRRSTIGGSSMIPTPISTSAKTNRK